MEILTFSQTSEYDEKEETKVCADCRKANVIHEESKMILHGSFLERILEFVPLLSPSFLSTLIISIPSLETK